MPLVPPPLGFKCRHLGGCSRSPASKWPASRSSRPMKARFQQHTTTRGGHLSPTRTPARGTACTALGPFVNNFQGSRWHLLHAHADRQQGLKLQTMSTYYDYRDEGPTSGISPSSTPDASESLSCSYGRRYADYTCHVSSPQHDPPKGFFCQCSLGTCMICDVL